MANVESQPPGAADDDHNQDDDKQDDDERGAVHDGMLLEGQCDWGTLYHGDCRNRTHSHIAETECRTAICGDGE